MNVSIQTFVDPAFLYLLSPSSAFLPLSLNVLRFPTKDQKPFGNRVSSPHSCPSSLLRRKHAIHMAEKAVNDWGETFQRQGSSRREQQPRAGRQGCLLSEFELSSSSSLPFSFLLSLAVSQGIKSLSPPPLSVPSTPLKIGFLISLRPPCMIVASLGRGWRALLERPTAYFWRARSYRWPYHLTILLPAG